MAVFVVVYDASGQLVGIERQEEASVVGRARVVRETERLARLPLTYAPAYDPLLYQFQSITADIRDSKALTDEQKQSVFAVYNTFHPGDRFQTAVQPPMLAQVRDGAPNQPAIIAVFVDP